jgi:biotin carboxyl carrier protein
MKARYRFLGEEYEIAPLERGDIIALAVNDSNLTVEEHDRDEGAQHFVVDHTQYDVFVARDGNDIFVHLDGEVWHVQAVNAVDAAGTGAGGADAVLAPMPGVVVSTPVTAGDPVSEGQTLIVIESMKLQTSIVADRDGVIAEVLFKVEETFDKGVELMRFESAVDETAE